MTSLYFMGREFKGLCLSLDEPLENRSVQLLFDDSWYWLHYQFFNCRDRICSESSSAVRTHLLNLAAVLYRSFEELPSLLNKPECELPTADIITELVQLAEYSRAFPISLWIAGDATSKEALEQALGCLPDAEKIAYLMKLPHFVRIERERLPYNHDAEELALKRFRREEASYNKRMKERRKNEQRKEKTA